MNENKPISQGYVRFYLRSILKNDKTRDAELITGCQGTGTRTGVEVVSQNKTMFLIYPININCPSEF